MLEPLSSAIKSGRINLIMMTFHMILLLIGLSVPTHVIDNIHLVLIAVSGLVIFTIWYLIGGYAKVNHIHTRNFVTIMLALTSIYFVSIAFIYAFVH